MKSFSILLGIMILFNITLGAQSDNDLKILLKFERDTYNLLEPWSFIVEFKNQGTSEINLLPTNIIGGRSSISAEIKLELRNRRNDLWVDTKCIENLCHTEGCHFITLNPNEIISYEFRTSSAFRLLDVGKNELRISYHPICHSLQNQGFYSTPIGLQILNNAVSDLDAYNYLLKLPVPDFVLYPIVQSAHDTSDIKYSRYLIDHFPNSTLSSYGTLNLCYQYLAKANYSDDKDKAIEYLRDSKRFGMLALKDKNLLISKKAELALMQLPDVIWRIYDFDVPENIEKEFIYPQK